MDPQIKAIADHALLATFAKEISDKAHGTALALDAALGANPPDGMIETVPAMVNLLISFDPIMTEHDAVRTYVQGCCGPSIKPLSGRLTRTEQVRNEAPSSPNLAAVSLATGLTPKAVINAHLVGDFRVLMYGFSPGYAYLSGVPDAIQVPRKPAPVRDVPAGPQCPITTLTMPTGWSIIGRSPTAILRGDSDAPFLVDVGDRVTF